MACIAYIWEKFSVESVEKYVQARYGAVSNPTDRVSRYYPTITLNEKTGVFTLSGGYVTSPSMGKYCPSQESNKVYLYDMVSSGWPPSYTLMHIPIKSSLTTVTEKGNTSYGKVVSKETDAYPENGEQDGYWYELTTALDLITDRTRADVDRVTYLAELWNPDTGWTGTSAELAEWMGGLRGAYNAVDLNRVGEAVSYIADRLTACGYAVSVSPKTDWATEDIPTPAQLTAYLSDVAAIRAVLAVLPTTPAVPGDMIGLTHREANAIEQILVDVDALISNMEQAWYYSGDLYAGEV